MSHRVQQLQRSADDKYKSLPPMPHLPHFTWKDLKERWNTGDSTPKREALHHTESMVSLCFRSLAGYINDDNLQGLQSFLENKQVLVDDRDENGSTALMLAATKGRIGFVRELLSHGADPNAEDSDSWSALLFAAKEGYSDVSHELLEHGANIEHRDMGNWTAVMWATYKGRTEVVTLLLERGADVNAHGNYHISSLLWAAGRGYTQIVQSLISHGAKVNVGDKYGTTSLIWACRKGYTEIVDCLLRAGANVDTAGMYSWTALLVATQGNHVDVINLLLEHKPNVNALDKDGCSALTIACKEGYYEIATALMGAGAYINIQDRAGDTNLIHAVKGGHRGIVETLLKKYADVDICGKDRKTATYMAVEKGNIAIVKLLLSANPDLEIATKDGDTPLLKAVRSRNSEIVQLLLDKKAKVSAADKKGDTALHIAMRARSKAIVEILLRNPKHSQLLYRPNRAGETPYNIDINHQKTILGQIFGARRLNTNEDNENMLGYDLYSSALADILSEPSLSMPITVGLYAKWGSGKSFLLNKLRDEMKNFAREWVDPAFQFNGLLFLIIVHVALIAGCIIGLSVGSWIAGLCVGVTVVFTSYLIMASIWFASKKYDWDWPYNVNVKLSRKMNTIKLILQILFCHPPGAPSHDIVSAQPIRFYFTDQTRVSSTTGGENSVVQMLGSLYDAIESDYGAIVTRLYRAFKPKPVKTSSSWKWRKLCCLPYVVIFEVVFICLLIGIGALTIFLLRLNGRGSNNITDVEWLTLHALLITTGLFLGITAVSNLYTWNKMFASLFFSQRRQLQRSIAKLDTLKSEGFLQAVRQEANLMKDMVKCLDSLNSQQTRLVIVVDGLDSCEQDKVLLVLDAIHMLFSDLNTPFVVILAIDPHVIAKVSWEQAVEMNSRRLFSESNIGGHSFLNNLVHLPFYLQNSGLRKVKIAQQTAQTHRKVVPTWNETDDNINLPGSSLLGLSLSNRRLSTESALMSSTEKLKFGSRKGSRKLKVSESIASSIGSNLNRIGGAQDLTKMLLTDDYFSDVNPRSMRRLMNVVYVTGRLLKAFQIDFNWYRLASWINITEQWPFRTSWIIYHYDLYEDSLDDNTPLKSLYDKVRPQIPSLKEIEPLLELDRDERKFDIFLTFHRSSLLVSDLKIFLPFTINLDPYLKKVIKEETQSIDDEGLLITQGRNMNLTHHQVSQQNNMSSPWNNTSSDWSNNRQSLNKRLRPFARSPPVPAAVVYPQPPGMMGWPQPWGDPLTMSTMSPPSRHFSLAPVTELSPEILESKLSTLTVEGVCKLLNKIEDLNASALSEYKRLIQESNVNGRVLLHCDLDELKKLLKMSFGDWEMFRVLIVSLREHELTSVIRQDEAKSTRMSNKLPSTSITRERKGSFSKLGSTLADKDKMQVDGSKNKQSIMEKQVTLEDQMICGALQTLNEEACEDVLEETEEIIADTDVPQTSIIPPSPENIQETRGCRSRTNSTSGIGETDYVILQSSPIGHMHWQPVSLSIQGNPESLSEHSSRGSSQPPSPVTERHNPNNIKLSNLKSSLQQEHVENQSRKPKHVQIKTDLMHDFKQVRPSSLHLMKNNPRIAKQYLRYRSKSMDTSHRNLKTEATDKKNTSLEKLHKLKEKLLHSNSNKNESNSDTESTPLVSEASSPSVASPEFNKTVLSSQSSASNSLQSSASGKGASHTSKYIKENKNSRSVYITEFSPTRSLNEDVISDSSLRDDGIDTWTFSPDKPRPRSRTMSECADSSVSYILDPSSRLVTASNVSLYSRASQSSGHLSRQDAIDSEENLTDVYCDPETKV